MPVRRALTCLAVGAVLVAGAPPAAADPVTGARQRAAALRLAVADLRARTDAAVEEYDAAEATLGAAVTARVSSDRALDAARRQAGTTGDVRRARVRELYQVGGSAAVWSSVLRAGSPVDALHGVHDAQRILGLDSRTAQADQATDARLAAAARAADEAARAQVRETRRVEDLVGVVTGLLGQQERLLGEADAEVVRLAEQQRRDAERQEQEAFRARLDAERAGAGELPASEQAAAVLAAARSRLGLPYVWGATGPDSFDCSGLTGWAYAAAGITLPRTSRQQWWAGPHPALADLQPGDLLFWATDPADPGTIHHVAIYAGGGRMIAAPHTGDVVKVQDVYADGYLGATRVLPPA